MEWTFPAAYGPEALAFLRADPVAHTVLLGVLAQKLVPHRTWAELRDDAGQVAGAAWCTPPWGLGVTDLPVVAAHELGALVAARVIAGLPGLVDLSTVFGPRETAQRVAERVAAGLGATVAPRLVETLYRIDAPDEIVADGRTGPAGRPRRANDGDLGLLTEWWSAFIREVTGRGGRTTVTSAC